MVVRFKPGENLNHRKIEKKHIIIDTKKIIITNAGFKDFNRMLIKFPWRKLSKVKRTDKIGMQGNHV